MILVSLYKSSFCKVLTALLHQVRRRRSIGISRIQGVA
jgi:hypothetical protein